MRTKMLCRKQWMMTRAIGMRCSLAVRNGRTPIYQFFFSLFDKLSNLHVETTVGRTLANAKNLLWKIWGPAKVWVEYRWYILSTFNYLFFFLWEDDSLQHGKDWDWGGELIAWYRLMTMVWFNLHGQSWSQIRISLPSAHSLLIFLEIKLLGIKFISEKKQLIMNWVYTLEIFFWKSMGGRFSKAAS